MRRLKILAAISPLLLTPACTALLGTFDFEGPAAGGGGGGGGGGSGGCQPLEQVTCYDGDPDTLLGPCHTGKKTCKPDGSGYGECLGQVLPAVEDDCAAKTDATCDGKLTCACTPKSMVDCYDGLAGTDTHLPCKGGLRTCADDGSGYGACEGQVTPKAQDDCTTDDVDENCDGIVNDLCTCQPGSMQPCYEGPDGTDGIGLCHGGSQSCNATGTGWEACGGQVLPKAEQCDIAGDEDCDGIKCSEPLWATIFPSGGMELVLDVGFAVDVQGASYVSFEYDGQVDFGNGVNASGTSAVLAKIGSDGKALWKIDSVASPVVATDAQENIYAMAPSGVVSYTSTGQLRWSKPLTGTGTGAIQSIVSDNKWGVIVAGYYYGGSLSFGTGSPTLPAGAGRDGFVAKYNSSNGNVVWAQRVGDVSSQTGADQYVDRVVCDAGARVFVTGTYSKSVGFGGVDYVDSTGSNTFFVAKLADTTGTPQWLKSFASPAFSTVADIALDAGGTALIIGNVSSGADFGGGNMLNHGARDTFLLKLDTLGAHVWSKLLGGTGDDMGMSAFYDSADNLVIAGVTRSATSNLGGAALAGPGVFLAKLNAAGDHLWSKSFGDNQYYVHVRRQPGNDDIFLAAANYGAIDFGTGPLTNDGLDSVVLARIQP